MPKHSLLCIFLGMLGTFWVRCDDRRQDIGVMRGLGASKTTIVRQFLYFHQMLCGMNKWRFPPLKL